MTMGRHLKSAFVWRLFQLAQLVIECQDEFSSGVEFLGSA